MVPCLWEEYGCYFSDRNGVLPIPIYGHEDTEHMYQESVEKKEIYKSAIFLNQQETSSLLLVWENGKDQQILILAYLIYYFLVSISVVGRYFWNLIHIKTYHFIN